VRKTPVGQILGSVYSSPAGISCGLLCPTASATFPAGTVVTLSASALLLAHLDGWAGDCSGTGTCVVTMDADRNVVAQFALGGSVAATDPSSGPSAVRLLSTLGVSAGRGELSINGSPQAVGEGAGNLVATARPGDNVVEARLTAGRSGGYWRFDVDDQRLVPGSLRVVAGELAGAGSGTLTFRIHGRAGERVAFAWTSLSTASTTPR
jgi:hypothetical protein